MARTTGRTAERGFAGASTASRTRGGRKPRRASAACCLGGPRSPPAAGRDCSARLPGARHRLRRACHGPSALVDAGAGVILASTSQKILKCSGGHLPHGRRSAGVAGGRCFWPGPGLSARSTRHRRRLSAAPTEVSALRVRRAGGCDGGAGRRLPFRSLEAGSDSGYRLYHLAGLVSARASRCGRGRRGGRQLARPYARPAVPPVSSITNCDDVPWCAGNAGAAGWKPTRPPHSERTLPQAPATQSPVPGRSMPGGAAASLPADGP